MLRQRCEGVTGLRTGYRLFVSMPMITWKKSDGLLSAVLHDKIVRQVENSDTDPKKNISGTFQMIRFKWYAEYTHINIVSMDIVHQTSKT